MVSVTLDWHGRSVSLGHMRTPTVMVLGMLLASCSSDSGSADGCDNDDDCKGDRICDDGECVESTSGNTDPGTCAVCGATMLTCAFASGHQEDVSLDSSTATGCSTSFDGDVLTVDCGAGEVCFEGSCSAQTIDNSFTFTFPGEGAVVCEPSG